MTSIAQQIEASRRETLAAIEKFLEDHAELNPSRFGRLAMGDPTFVYEIRKGRKMEPETIDSLVAFMATYKTPRKQATRGNVAARSVAA